MGILREPADAIRRLVADQFPEGGFSVCELGDQYLTYESPHVLSRDFFRDELKSFHYVSIDGNGRGTNVEDLNVFFARNYDPFDIVTDFGTGEHVFDQANLWRNIHYLTKRGGFIAFDRPSQGYPGHCYYRTDPCYFEDIARANGYEWVWKAERVKPPGSPRYRGDLIRGILRKTMESPKYFRIPQQGRYHAILKPIMPGGK